MKKKSNGFTLIEVVVVVVIASLFGMLVMKLFSQTNIAQPKITGNIQMQSTALTGTNKLLRSIREGRHFIAPRFEENSPILVFLDNQKNVRAIFAEEDKEYSARFKRKLFRLVQYDAETKSLDLSNPVNDPKKVKEICRHVADVVFRLAGSSAVTVKIKFANESQEFETLSESSLMNSGEND